MLEGFLKIVGAYKLYRKWLENSIKSKPVPQHIG
ncbi:MAG: UDP diphosphate synthase, partial [Thermoprotei archaeon]